MSGFLSSIFGGSQQQSAPAPQNQGPAQGQQPQSPQQGQQGQQPQGQGFQNNQGHQGGGNDQGNPPAQPSENPLDALSHLWQNKPNSATNTPPAFSLPDDALGQAANSLDFTQSIKPEDIQRLQSGDVSALPDILNSALRAQYQVLMKHTTGLTNNYLDNRLSYERQGTERLIGDSMTTNSLQSTEGLHPFARQMLQDTVIRMRESNPQATPQQLEQAAIQMLHSLANQFDVQGRKQQQQAAAKEPNWDNYGGFTN